MRIQTNIFLWGFFAFVVPITALALIATYYSQARYLTNVQNNVNQSLRVLSAEIERRLSADRRLTYGLSQAPAVQKFLSVLNAITLQQLPLDFDEQREALNRFFEGFQTIIPGNFFIRILDNQGNTLIKVSHKQRSQAIYESLQGFSYVEQEVNNPDFVKRLMSLPKADVSALALPHNKNQSELLTHLSLLDNVIPLYFKNKWVGAMSLTILGEDIDTILNHAIRPHQGQLFIIESAPDLKSRHGLILFDDATKTLFSHARPEAKYIQQTEFKSILDKPVDIEKNIYISKKSNSSVHYIEMTPYPNQFTNWIMALTVFNSIVNQPYAKIRITIWTVATIALIIGLLITQFGAKQVTRALSALVLNFKNYAKGDQNQVAVTKHCVDEIKDLGDAFNEMIHTLNNAHSERDKAQQMMLQSGKLASIGQMAAGIGHEINNPLNNILSYAKLAIRTLENSSINDESKQSLLSDLHSLREETLRASEIVKGIMNFARQVPPHITEFDIKTWLTTSISLVQQSANNKAIQINLVLNIDDNLLLKGDRGQLQQVLVNLLLNAIYASMEHSIINVNVTEDSGNLCTSIIDSGSGIQSQDINLIFDPFFTTKQQGHGTGLGLSISLGIIQHHQGTLEIQNRKNNAGVIAIIKLPLLV